MSMLFSLSKLSPLCLIVQYPFGILHLSTQWKMDGGFDSANVVIMCFKMQFCWESFRSIEAVRDTNTNLRRFMQVPGLSKCYFHVKLFRKIHLYFKFIIIPFMFG